MNKYLVVRYADAYDEENNMKAVAPELIERDEALLCELADEDVKALRNVNDNGYALKALEIVEPQTVREALDKVIAEQAAKRHKAAIAAEARAKKRAERKAREAANAAELEKRLLAELKEKYGDSA